MTDRSDGGSSRRLRGSSDPAIGRGTDVGKRAKPSQPDNVDAQEEEAHMEDRSQVAAPSKPVIEPAKMCQAPNGDIPTASFALPMDPSGNLLLTATGPVRGDEAQRVFQSLYNSLPDVKETFVSYSIPDNQGKNLRLAPGLHILFAGAAGGKTTLLRRFQNMCPKASTITFWEPTALDDDSGELPIIGPRYLLVNELVNRINDGATLLMIDSLRVLLYGAEGPTGRFGINMNFVLVLTAWSVIFNRLGLVVVAALNPSQDDAASISNSIGGSVESLMVIDRGKLTVRRMRTFRDSDGQSYDFRNLGGDTGSAEFVDITL